MRDFSELVTDNKIEFMVYGKVDLDGLPEIETVYQGLSIDNLWPCIESDYYAGNGGLGDRLYEAVKEIVIEQDRRNALVEFEEAA